MAKEEVLAREDLVKESLLSVDIDLLVVEPGIVINRIEAWYNLYMIFIP